MKSEAIAKKIQDARLIRNLSKAEFSRILGISHTGVNKLESGKSLPSMETLKNLWFIFGLDPKEMLSLLDKTNQNTKT